MGSLIISSQQKHDFHEKYYVNLSFSHNWNNLSSCFKVVYQWIFNSVRNRSETYKNRVYWNQTWPWMKREARRMGQLAHRGGQAARSRAHFGPTLASVVFGPLLSKFCDFLDRISSCCRDVSPPHLFSYIPLCTTCGDKTHIQKK